jgi:hypothetical protein
MIQNMSVEDFLDVASTIRKDMSFQQLNVASAQFSQDKEITFEEAKGILLIALGSLQDDSAKYILSCKEQRIKELHTLGIQIEGESV